MIITAINNSRFSRLIKEPENDEDLKSFEIVSSLVGQKNKQDCLEVKT
jgi:hypothetical protein